MIRTGFKLLALQMCIWIAACGLLPENKETLVSGKSDIVRLKVPAPLSPPQFLDPFPIPDLPAGMVAEPPSKKIKLLQPKPLEIIWDDQKVQLRKKGARQWIRLNAAPGQVWRLMRQYMQEASLAVDREDARLGTLESEWLSATTKNAALFSDSATKDSQVYRKLRIRVEKGNDADVSLLYVSIIEQLAPPLSQSKSMELDWTVTDTLLPQVNTTLTRLHRFLLQQDYSKTDITLAGQSVSAEPLAEITWLDGRMTLKLRQDFNYGWKRVGDALKNGKYPVKDLNRAQGIYYLDLMDESGDIRPFYKQLLKNANLKKEEIGRGRLYLSVRSEKGLTFVAVKSADNVQLSRDMQSALLSSLKEDME